MDKEIQLGYYYDYKLTELVKRVDGKLMFDFGVVDVDDTKTLEFYVINYGTADLHKIRLETKSSDVKILECPTDLPADKRAKIKVAWQPKSGNPLLEEWRIVGKYVS